MNSIYDLNNEWFHSFNVDAFFKTMWKEFIYGGHIFAVGAISVAYMCALLCSIPITLDLMVVIYLIFYTIYLYDYCKGADKDKLTNSERATYLKNGNKLGRTTIVLYVCILSIGLIYSIYSDITNMLYGFFVLVMGLLYHSHFKALTKRVPAFKNIFVSIVWALLILSPFIYYSYPVTSTALLLSTFVFLRMVSIQILFDIRDVESDKKEGLLTIPVLFGDKDMSLLKALNVATILLLVYGLYYSIIPPIAIMAIFIFFYAHDYLEKAKAAEGKSCFILAAAEPMLWIVLIQSGAFVVTVLRTSAFLL